jgi:ATP:ADP antiporter, AAA family
MSTGVKSLFRNLFAVERHELLKVILLSITFFLVIGAYTVTLELKNAVFLNVIGQDRKLIAYAKIFSMFYLVPIIFFHSRLVDVMKRHHLLYFYSIAYAVLGFVFVIFFGHPTIGLANTVTSPTRLFGWLFYFYIEGYVPLVTSVFWAFSNSITAPQSAKNNYTVMIAGSKLGGITIAGISWIVLKKSLLSDVANLQVILGLASTMLCGVPFLIYYLIKNVPQHELHGYEAAYKLEKERQQLSKEEEPGWFHGILAGLMLLFKYPYVMGIFGMSFFFELINQALKIESIIFGKNASHTLSEFMAFLLWQALLVHIVAFIVVVFGTRALIGYLGMKRSLMLVPTATGLSMLGFILRPSYATAIFSFVVTRSVNYAFAAPLRESLYIPTIKEVQFKSKSWIDGVGIKFAKTCASSFNMYTDGLVGPALLAVQSSFFSVVTLLWLLVAYALGWRFEKAVKRNEVIGAREVTSHV